MIVDTNNFESKFYYIRNERDRTCELIQWVDVLGKMVDVIPYVDNPAQFYKDACSAETSYVDNLSSLVKTMRDIKDFNASGETVRSMAELLLPAAGASCNYRFFVEYGCYAFDGNRLRKDMKAVMDRIGWLVNNCPECQAISYDVRAKHASIRPVAKKYINPEA